MSRNKKIIICGVVISLGIIILLAILLCNRNKNQVIYKETKVEKGSLAVGITESGDISIGTVDQTFDLDLSAFEAGNSNDSSNKMSGVMGMFKGMSGNGSSSDEKSYSRDLDIEEVLVTAGQKITTGDVLFTLTKESVSSIREELEYDETSAKLTYEKLENEQRKSRLTAQQTKETSQIHQSLAEYDYQETIRKIDELIADKEDEIQDATDTVSENQIKIDEKKKELIVAQNILEHAEYAIANMDTTLLYEYGKQADARDTAKKQVDSLEDEIEKLEDENESYANSYTGLLLELKELTRNKELETIEANKNKKETIQTGADSDRMYEVSIGYLDADLKEAKDDYEEASQKLSEFNSYIVNNQVLAEYDGVITEVSVEEGDTLSSAKTLITLNNQGDTSMTVEVSSADIESVNEESIVRVVIDSLEDVMFTGKVYDISDATINSSTGAITYEVKVLLEGDVSNLYEGMTGDVTFITKETKEVTYVMNRAIIREGIHSFVNVKDETGKIYQKEVITGFSDGLHVEIKEGLLEGDVVYIESKVTES